MFSARFIFMQVSEICNQPRSDSLSADKSQESAAPPGSYRMKKKRVRVCLCELSAHQSEMDVSKFGSVRVNGLTDSFAVFWCRFI